MRTILNSRLIFVSGKGGVGKTTIASKLALLQAEAQHNTLIVELNSLGNVAKLFDLPSCPNTIQVINKTLHTINLTPAACFEEYVLRQIKFKFLFKTFFDNRLVKHFVSAIPGLNELLMLGKVIDLLKAYDHIIVDAQASGHGLSSLQVPYVVKRVVKFGPLHHQAQKIITALEDHNTTSVALVTLLEEMPVNETLESFATLTKTSSLHFAGVFINQALKNVPEILEAKKNLSQALKPYWQIYEFARMRFTGQQEQLQSLQKTFAASQLTSVAYLPNGAHNKTDLADLELF